MSATKLSSQNAQRAGCDARLQAETALIDVDGVMIMRGGRTLFRNVSFALAGGGVAQLAGVNGAGKTSLLRALAGALPVAQGRVTLAAAASCAFLPADDALWHGPVAVRAALRDWAAILDVSPARVDDVLAQLALSALAERSLATLSMGQKRRLSWARLLLRTAPLWLLDEPFNSLDRDGLARVLELVRTHLAAGGAAVMACHDDLGALLPGHGVVSVTLAPDGGG